MHDSLYRILFQLKGYMEDYFRALGFHWILMYDQLINTSKILDSNTQQELTDVTY